MKIRFTNLFSTIGILTLLFVYQTNVFSQNESLEETKKYAQTILDNHEANGQTLGAVSGISWTPQGPDNVGGRTRAIMFDPTDPTQKTVIAGSVSGGLWKNTDITNASTSWTPLTGFSENLAVSAIAFDPTNTSTWYVTTGEAFLYGSVLGNGVYKSIDAGVTWTSLATFFDSHNITSSIVVKDEGGVGVVYFGGKSKVIGNYPWGQEIYGGQNGLYRSADGGTTFTQVLPQDGVNDLAVDHVEIDASGNLWAVTGVNEYYHRGGDIYTCTSGCDTTANWIKKFDATDNGFYLVERTVFATAPSDAQTMYAIGAAASTSWPTPQEQDVVFVIKSTDGGTTWTSMPIPVNTDPSAGCIQTTDHFTKGEGDYNLCLAIHPTNPNLVLFGGIDQYRTTDGFTTYSHCGSWVNGGGACTNVIHSDQHAILFRPGFPNEVIYGNDGGVYYAADGGSAALPNFEHRVKDYNVTQFNACDIHPTAGTNISIGGAKDNGTQYFNSSSTTVEVSGGDGGFCHIDQNNPAIQIAAGTYNDYTYTNDNWLTSHHFSIGTNQGRYINATDYDYVNDILYGAHDYDFISRSSGFAAGTASGSAIAANIGGSKATAIRVSRNTPTTIYVGNDAGGIFKIENANTGTMTPVSINPGGFGSPEGYISSIDVEKGNELHLLVTISNFYSSGSIWESTDGGTTWTKLDGNIIYGPIRWGIFSPINDDQIFVATDFGVYSTDDINGNSTVWGANNSGIGNVRCDMIRYRHDDGTARSAAASATLIVATHGRGMFTSPISATPLNVELFSFKATPLDASISLDWETALEINNKGFEVQRRTNQEDEFSTIGWVDGNGNVTTISAYSLEDNEVTANTDYYYRLKQLDFNGRAEYSNIVSAKITNSIGKEFAVYPSPTVDQVTVNLPYSSLSFTIQLFDTNGRLVQTWRSEKEANSMDLDLTNFPKGTYVLTIMNLEIQRSSKLSIVK